MLIREAATAQACMISEEPNTELADPNHFTCMSTIFSIPAVFVGRDAALFCPSLSKLSRSQRPRGLRSGCAAARLLDCGLELREGHGCLSVENVVCCQVEVSAGDQPLLRRSPTECGVSQCDLVT